MFESDADRLVLIRALGGEAVEAPNGAITAIFEEGYAAASLEVDAEGTQPYLLARTIDVQEIRLAKGQTVTKGTRVFKVVRLEAMDEHMTRIVVSE